MEKDFKSMISIIVTMVLIIVCNYGALAQENIISITPTDDSYAPGHTLNTSGPFGNNPTLRTRFRAAGEWRFDAYLKFNIAELQGQQIQSATVELYTSTATNGQPISLLMRETTTEWSEQTLVAANRPTWGNEIVTIQYTGEAGWYEWDVTSLVNSLVEAQIDLVSLVITPLGGGGDQDVYFNSKENEDNTSFPALKVQLVESADLSASDISINGTTVDGFSAEIIHYNMVLPWNTVDIPVVAATATDPEALVDIAQAISLDGTPEDRTASVTISIAEESAVYTVTFELATPPDLLASDITVNGNTIENFSAQVTEYNISLPWNTVDIPVVAAIASDPQAQVEVTQAVNLSGTLEERTAVITISIGEDYSVYSVTFEIEETPIPYANSILVDGILVNGFDPMVNHYNIILPWDTQIVPVINASCDIEEADITIIQAQSVSGSEEERSAVITLTLGEQQAIYTLVFSLGDQELVATPSDDSYAPGHTLNSSGPFGDQPTMRTRFRAAGEWRFDAYLKFDIPDLGDYLFTGAKIRLYTETDGGSPIAMQLKETTTDWSEETMVAANRPVWMETVTTTEYLGTEGWYEWDISSLIERLINEGTEVVSVVITPQGGGGDQDVFFMSKENPSTAHHPVMTITFEENQIVDPIDLVLTDLQVDNTTLPDFAEDKLNYLVVLPENTVDIPVVTATSKDPEAKLTITQATSLTGTETDRTALVLLERGDETVTYSVVFEVEDPDPTFVDNHIASEIYLFATQGRLHINTANNLNTNFEIFTITGSCVAKGKITDLNTIIDLNGINSGLYLLRIEGNNPSTHKFIIN